MPRNPSSGRLPRLTRHKVRKEQAHRGRGRATNTAPTRQPGRRPSTVAVGLVTRTYTGSPVIAALVPIADATVEALSACFVGRGRPHLFTSFQHTAYPRAQGNTGRHRERVINTLSPLPLADTKLSFFIPLLHLHGPSNAPFLPPIPGGKIIPSLLPLTMLTDQYNSLRQTDTVRSVDVWRDKDPMATRTPCQSSSCVSPT